MTTEEQELNQLREQIDNIDYDIHDLLNERAKIALKVSSVKIKHGGHNVTFYRPEREKIIIDKVKAHNTGPLDEASIVRIFEAVLAECRNLQIKTHAKK